MNRFWIATFCFLLASASVLAQGSAAPGDAPYPKPAPNACSLPPKTSPFTFWDSCRNVRMDACTLRAQCRTRDGNWRDTSFNMAIFDQCHSDFFGGRNLVNDNGKLCCGYAGTKIICGT
jgi:hypothetical protein